MYFIRDQGGLSGLVQYQGTLERVTKPPVKKEILPLPCTLSLCLK